GTVYCYLVNDHWRPDAAYSMLNLADPTVAINWPIPLDSAVVSPKDRTHPALGQVVPVPGRKTLVIGANGQLGQALQGLMSADDDVEWVDVDTFDIADPDLESARRWPEYQTIINAAAYTAVDAAETPEGRLTAWKVNAVGPAALARIAAHHHLTLVHVSTDYVFDGTSPHPYREDDLPCPLGVYGQTKAAADLAICAVPRHYLIRTSWVVGSGPNFMRTMATLATRGISPKVVDDQIGRVTFADDLACAIVHLLESQAPFGTYNVTGGGETMSWAEVACQVYASLGVDPALVKPCSTKEYQAGTPGPIAPRPANSTLDLSKIRAAGFVPPPLSERLEGYLASLAGG
ncbi:MAG: bifunctional dTDP-4-dehydrorhamnose 3,5-epimerase family protein/NAD(P)-dependent oxidoreductase, partial [Micrococcales bacterium]|nr:bifunctional dTDP-4-dehydrorhamnose 3,5-epimerase family protein/NAD(P)-dependent oxidoreductase [Micrococcales bacterium]